MKTFRTLSVILMAAAPLPAQTYDLILKGGHVIDPANKVDRVLDVAVSGSRIARVAPDIPASQATKTVNVSGLYVTPGLVDIHAHVYVGGRLNALFPDDTALTAGSTTVVDAGIAGWRTFDDFKRRIIDKSKTRVLAFLNIVGSGMGGTKVENNVADMDPAATAAKVKQHPDLIVGIKTAHFGLPGWDALKRAVEAGRLCEKPVLVDSSILSNTGRNTREKVLDVMRPGDIHSHAYNDRQLELLDRFSGKVQPHMLEARKRGVLFDLGHGGGSFVWPVAARAMREGFPPDIISTDSHPSSYMLPQVNMPNCISKLMALGMELQDAIRRSTEAPARAIHRFPEIGTLGEGRIADIAVFELQRGTFALKDSWKKKLLANRKLECVLTIRNGELVYDLNGLAFPLWSTAGDYEVIP
jgi:dihydroorotase